MVKGNSSIRFSNRKDADKSLSQIETLLNKYLVDIENEYTRLLIEKILFVRTHEIIIYFNIFLCYNNY